MKRVTLEELREIAAPARFHIKRIYLHWTAGRYHQFFNDYHINIDEDGAIMLSTDDLTDVKAHTWRRNTGAIGIALACCYNAQANGGYNTYFGEFPPTTAQIEAMAQVIAVLCGALALPIDYEHVRTHAEQALEDGYGAGSGDPETRWDLWFLQDNPYDGYLKSGGYILRGKANWYKANEKYPIGEKE